MPAKTLKLKLQSAQSVALVMVGSDLRADDAAALLVAEELKALSGAGKVPARIFLGHTAPENITGQIKAYNPTHLVIIDAADMRKKPGSIAVLEADDIALTHSFSTHSLPLSMFITYIRQFLACEVAVIAIQPACLDMGVEPSAAVRKSAQKIAAALAQIVKLK